MAEILAYRRIQHSLDSEENWKKYNPAIRSGEILAVFKSDGTMKFVINKDTVERRYNDEQVVTMYDELDATKAKEAVANIEPYMKRAETAATNAATSANTATTAANTATTQASNASKSASNANTSEKNAATSAATASTKSDNAADSASSAATSATNAASSAKEASDALSQIQTDKETVNNILSEAQKLGTGTSNVQFTLDDEGYLAFNTTL